MDTLTRIDLLNSLPLHSIGAELGVFLGDFSEKILEIVQPKMLNLVDRWDGWQVSGDKDGANSVRVFLPDEMPNVMRRFAGRNVRIFRACSYEWMALQPQDSLDWVYIDTNHEYQTTCRELLAARQVVKPKGWICGHDHHEEFFPGVCRAVREFCAEWNLPVKLYTDDRLPSFQIPNEK